MLIYKELRKSTIINANKQHSVYFDENKERRTENQEDAFYSCRSGLYLYQIINSYHLVCFLFAAAVCMKHVYSSMV